MPSSYPFKARTKDGEYITFTLADIPLFISNDEFILAMRENSPILKKGDLYKGCDIDGVFDGDVIEYNNERFIVTYQRGFCLRSEKHFLTMDQIDMSKAINLGSYLDVGFDDKVRINKKVVLKYKNTNMWLSSITGKYGDRAIITGVSALVDPTEIQLYAGLRYDNRKLYFGDFVKGFALFLYKGRPVIRDENGIYDIAENKYLV